MKGLILTHSAWKDNTNYKNMLFGARSTLEGLGITYDLLNVSFAPAVSALNTTYDFIWIIRPGSVGAAYKNIIDHVALKIPVFIMYFTTSVTPSTEVSAANSGVVDGSAISSTYQFFTSIFTASVYTAGYGSWWTLAANATPLITSAPAQTVSPYTTQSGEAAGKSAAWSVPLASGLSHLYGCGFTTDNANYFAVLLQTAINNGDFSASAVKSIRKAPVFIDQDHVNGSSFYQNEVFLRRWLDAIPANGVSVCGITSPFPGQINSMSTGVKAALLSAYASGKLKFCYHDHTVGQEVWQAATAWPIVGRGGTLAATGGTSKTGQETNYAYVKGLWESAGFTFNSKWYVPATNCWNEATLELFSAETSIASDGANATGKAGYGFTMVRNSTSNQCTYPAQNVFAYPSNVLKQRWYTRGMTIVPSNDLCLTDASATRSQWHTKMSYIASSMCYGNMLYVHDEDFIDVQDPATAEYGVEILRIINDFAVYCKDVAIFWADAEKYSLTANRV